MVWEAANTYQEYQMSWLESRATSRSHVAYVLQIILTASASIKMPGERQHSSQQVEVMLRSSVARNKHHGATAPAHGNLCRARGNVDVLQQGVVHKLSRQHPLLYTSAFEAVEDTVPSACLTVFEQEVDRCVHVVYVVACAQSNFAPGVHLPTWPTATTCL